MTSPKLPYAPNAFDAVNAEQSPRPEPSDDNLCPECNGTSVCSCRCFRRDSTCKNGHNWHTCTVHHVKVQGHSNHGTDTFSCTCLKGKR